MILFNTILNFIELFGTYSFAAFYSKVRWQLFLFIWAHPCTSTTECGDYLSLFGPRPVLLLLQRNDNSVLLFGPKPVLQQSSGNPVRLCIWTQTCTTITALQSSGNSFSLFEFTSRGRGKVTTAGSPFSKAESRHSWSFKILALFLADFSTSGRVG